ncbi:MAG TPA: HAD-IIIA family hydrolase [Burkholderiaceae bacterium]|nr:HAD-IIIA family hydrolase [Burkholderiaceae bacterium]
MTPAQRAARVRIVVLDVDGVLTDGRLYYGPQGEAIKVFDVRDGHGVKMLLAHGIDVAIISARSSPIVDRRASELGIGRVLQGRGDKAAAFRELLANAGLQDDDAAFVGDDLPDLPVLRRAGFAITVEDARDEVKEAAHWVAPCPGGRAAVRAAAEFILRAQGVDLMAMVQA